MIVRLALLALAGALSSIPAAADPLTGKETTKAVSSVTVQVEPALSDGRLAVKIAAKNTGGAALQFGSAHVQLFTADGTRIGWRPLRSLIGDVHAAYGMEPEADSAAPLTGASSNQLQSQTFQPDVSNYHGSSTVAQTQAIALNSKRSKKKVSPENQRKAEAEISLLKMAIIQDRLLPPGGLAAGMLVSEKLKRGVAGKPMKLTVTIGTDLYSFNFKAPAQ